MDKQNSIPDSDIIREYQNCYDIKKLSTKFKMPISEVRKVLKQAGITVDTKRKINSIHSDLNEVGMSESDFYSE